MVRISSAQIAGVSSAGSRVRISLRAEVVPAPGQFCLASAHGYLRRALFPTRTRADGWEVEVGEVGWSVGAEIGLLGPCGQGFSLPPAARNVLLIAFADSPARLLGVAHAALARDAAVTLLCARQGYPLDWLAPEIEVRQSDDVTTLLPEALAWADAVYVEPGNADQLDALMGSAAALPWRAAQTQVLLTPPMPCGVGACGACALSTPRGWKLACADGPVFQLSDLAS